MNFHNYIIIVNKSIKWFVSWLWYIVVTYSCNRKGIIMMLEALEMGIVTVKGVKVVNTTPHPIRLTDDSLELDITVEPSGVLINAKAQTVEAYSSVEGVSFQMTEFVADKETKLALQDFLSRHSDVVIVGSLIAAQAYPGLVVAMVAHPDFMRVAPQEKRMLYNRYTVYPGHPDCE